MKKKYLIFLAFLIVLNTASSQTGGLTTEESVELILLNKQKDSTIALQAETIRIADSIHFMDSVRIQFLIAKQEVYKVKESAYQDKLKFKDTIASNQLKLSATNLKLAVLKEKNKRFSFGVSIGYGAVYRKTNQVYSPAAGLHSETELQMAPFVGLTVSYNFLKF